MKLTSSRKAEPVVGTFPTLSPTVEQKKGKILDIFPTDFFLIFLVTCSHFHFPGNRLGIPNMMSLPLEILLEFVAGTSGAFNITTQKHVGTRCGLHRKLIVLWGFSEYVAETVKNVLRPPLETRCEDSHKRVARTSWNTTAVWSKFRTVVELRDPCSHSITTSLMYVVRVAM